jgi:hypothetical protein
MPHRAPLTELKTPRMLTFGDVLATRSQLAAFWLGLSDHRGEQRKPVDLYGRNPVVDE